MHKLFSDIKIKIRKNFLTFEAVAGEKTTFDPIKLKYLTTSQLVTL